jgi:hypothetical protein
LKAADLLASVAAALGAERQDLSPDSFIWMWLIQKINFNLTG